MEDGSSFWCEPEPPVFSEWGSDDDGGSCFSSPEPEGPFSYSSSRIVLDWDDSLLCSSWLVAHGCSLAEPVPEEAAAALHKLEVVVQRMLSKACAMAPVVIVTAAEEGWVQRSCAHFMRSLLPLLSQVTVVSARSMYERHYGAGTGTAHAWKQLAFHQLLSADEPDHVLSFGDSTVERDAMRIVTQQMPMTLCKTFKFVAHPSIEQLIDQLQVVTQGFSELFWHMEELDLILQPTNA